MSILNLTQHNATPDQVLAGVVEPANKEEVRSLLTFTELPTWDDVKDRASRLAQVAYDESWEKLPDGATQAIENRRVMIGGAPYLMSALEKELKSFGLVPVYAFSQRVVSEVQQEDGTVKKLTMFDHLGFVEV